MGEWVADIATDPDRDHQLIVELREDERFRSRLYRDPSGLLKLRVYHGDMTIPVEWLCEIIDRFRDDLDLIARNGPQD